MDEIRELRGQRLSIRKIAKRVGISHWKGTPDCGLERLLAPQSKGFSKEVTIIPVKRKLAWFENQPLTRW